MLLTLLLRSVTNTLKRLNKVAVKLALEKFFIEQLWQLVLVVAIISFFAWLLNKPYETIMFCISHLVLRPQFDKQYHCGTVYYCIFTTITVAFLGISTCLPVSISLLSALPVAFFVCWLGYIVQDRFDIIAENANLEKEMEVLCAKIKELSNIDIYRMPEDELRQYGASKGLSEIQQDILVMRVIEHLKISEICSFRNYGRTTIKYHLGEIRKKLGIDNV